MYTPTLIHVHTPNSDVVLVTNPMQDPQHWVAALNRHAADGSEWAAIPPAGSEWERVDWDAAARRCGL